MYVFADNMAVYLCWTMSPHIAWHLTSFVNDPESTRLRDEKKPTKENPQSNPGARITKAYDVAIQRYL